MIMSLSYKNPSCFFLRIRVKNVWWLCCASLNFKSVMNSWTCCLLFKAALNKRSAHAKVPKNDNGLNVIGIKGLVSFKMSHMSEKETLNKSKLKRFVPLFAAGKKLTNRVRDKL